MDALPSPDCPVWLGKTNTDSFDTDQLEQGTPYPTAISGMIEKAFCRGSNEVCIKEEQQIDDLSQQCPIRSKIEREAERWNRERYAFPLDTHVSQSTTIDTQYHGSPLIISWFESFTNGKLKLTFNRIFEPLVEGIRKEGHEQCDPHTDEIIDFLYTIKNVTSKVRDIKRMKKLQEACAKLYTKDCFLFVVTNRTLRDNDRSKMITLGPFCYLIYNYIGKQLTDNHLSIQHRLRQLVYPNESRSMTVYRGDYVTTEKIEEYRQAVDKKDRYFKWLPFVSTTLDIEVAEKFSRNVLYIIELSRYTSNDQFVSLENNSYFKNEVEILLRPGVRFRINQVKFDEKTDREHVYIQIVSSYVSNLR